MPDGGRPDGEPTGDPSADEFPGDERVDPMSVRGERAESPVYPPSVSVVGGTWNVLPKYPLGDLRGEHRAIAGDGANCADEAASGDASE